MPSDPKPIEVLGLSVDLEIGKAYFDIRVYGSERAEQYLMSDMPILYPSQILNISYSYYSVEEALNIHGLFLFDDMQRELGIYGVNCYGESDCFKKLYDFYELTSSVNPSLEDEEIILHPNPVRDILHIDGDIFKIKSIRICNSLGQTAFLIDCPQENQLDLSSLSSGNYLVNIQFVDKRKNEIIKLIKTSD